MCPAHTSVAAAGAGHIHTDTRTHTRTRQDQHLIRQHALECSWLPRVVLRLASPRLGAALGNVRRFKACTSSRAVRCVCVCVLWGGWVRVTRGHEEGRRVSTWHVSSSISPTAPHPSFHLLPDPPPRNTPMTSGPSSALICPVRRPPKKMENGTVSIACVRVLAWEATYATTRARSLPLEPLFPRFADAPASQRRSSADAHTRRRGNSKQTPERRRTQKHTTEKK